MKLRTRLILLLGFLFLVFTIRTLLLQASHRHEVQQMLAELKAERTSMLNRVLRSPSLTNFVVDTARSDEMVRFLDTADPAWARLNIDANLAIFRAQAAWVTRQDGTLVYASPESGIRNDVASPLRDPEFLTWLRRADSSQFFWHTPHGVVHVRLAPIVAPGGAEVNPPPRGWFFVARLWDDAYMKTIGETMEGRAWVSTAPWQPQTADTVHLESPLLDWRNRTVGFLHVEHSSRSLNLLLEGNKYELTVVILFSLTIIVVTALFLSLWVVRPINRLRHSLELGHAAPLADLVKATDEFGDLARQVSGSFAQRAILKENERLLRESMTLRGRLARDLHDGIIQSIYAAGMGLEGISHLREANPAAAERRLVSSQRMLNDAIWQLRSFITALEPESEHRATSGQSLATLAASMQSLQAVPIAVDLDPDLVLAIGPVAEMQLLQISRELLSNALRHSGARAIRIALHADPDHTVSLEISDDGVGFDPAEPHGAGHGLRNVAARAAEIGATLTIDSAPGKGARISVRFHASPSATG